jgi:DNA-binding MarR family transcriptional regulator
VRTTPRGAEVFAVVREFVTEIDARLEARLGAAKLQRLRALLTELDAAL